MGASWEDSSTLGCFHFQMDLAMDSSELDFLDLSLAYLVGWSEKNPEKSPLFNIGQKLVYQSSTTNL